MLFEGDKTIFSRLLQKKRLLKAGDSEADTIRPALLILGGNMSGVYGGGQVCALEEYVLNDAFDVVAGASTGAATGGFFSAWQSALGTSIYHEECTTRDFISLSRWPPVNCDYVADVFRGVRGDKKLDEKAIHASRSKLFMAVTCARTGKGVLLDAKKVKPDIVQAIRASIAMPTLSGPPVIIGEDAYIDGGGALPLPLSEVVEKFDPTDVLILANMPKRSGDMAINKIQLIVNSLKYRFATLPYNRRVRATFGSSHTRLAQCSERLWDESSVRVGVIWSDGLVRSFERNSTKLRAASARAQKHLSDILAKANDLPG